MSVGLWSIYFEIFGQESTYSKEIVVFCEET